MYPNSGNFILYILVPAPPKSEMKEKKPEEEQSLSTIEILTSKKVACHFHVFV